MTDHQKMRSLRRFITIDDPHYPGKKKLKVRGRDLQTLATEGQMVQKKIVIVILVSENSGLQC